MANRQEYSSATYRLTLHFDANGGDTAPANVKKDRSSSAASVSVSVQIPAELPTRAGYTFTGYATSANGNVEYQPGDTVSHSFSRIATYNSSYTYYDKVTESWITVDQYTSSDQSRLRNLYAQWELAAEVPTIVQQPSSVSTYKNAVIALECVATVSSGTLSYQWQQSTDGGNTWADIVGATSTQYTPNTSTIGTIYYRAVVVNTVGTSTSSATSNSVYVTVGEVTAPIFSTQPMSATIPIGVAAEALTASATSNATITYQWVSSPNGSVWTAISGETNNSYTPPTTTVGTTYYKVVATATGAGQSKQTDSEVATITVYEATVPVFIRDLSLIDVTYNAADYVSPLDGTATAVGTLTYQWQRSIDGGITWQDIAGATTPIYTPSSRYGGVSKYRVIAVSTAGTSVQTATSGVATINVINVVLTPDTKWTQYLAALKRPFVKLARLDFLNPNGSVAFSLDNNVRNSRSKAFIQSGDLSVNMQNGQRRTASVTLSNLNGEYDYNVNKLWFGQQVRLWEGMILPNGEDFYISQGVFYVKDPEEVFEPGLKQTTLNLVDKWAYLDGTLFGNLDGTYEVPLNSNIFNAIQSILNLDRGNGQKVDSTPPVFTGYYNGKTTTLPDGSTVPLTNTPYTYRCDSENGTYADIILEMNTMLAGWIGYDAYGQLRLSPSQDDILDQTKPIQWEFTPLNSTFLGATYSVKNSEVYNDIIIIGESLSEYGQTAGRATNYDPMSDTNANIIGLKTKRYQQSGYYTQDICESLAVFKLKRESVLKKSVSIKCSQMFHLQENNLVTIQRTDKPGAPVERHLITGFSRPIAQTGAMTINCTSVNDYPVATITKAF